MRRARSTRARRPTARSTASSRARRPSISRRAPRYIWSLAVAPDGALYVGTGDQGKIFRVTAAGQGRAVLRDRTVPRHQPGDRSRGPAAGRQRAERNPVPRHREGQGLRAVRRESAGDPLHRRGAGWIDLRGGAGRLGRQARARRVAGRAGGGCVRRRRRRSPRSPSPPMRRPAPTSSRAAAGSDRAASSRSRGRLRPRRSHRRPST